MPELWDQLATLPQVVHTYVVAAEHNSPGEGTGADKAAWVHEQILGLVSPPSAPRPEHEAILCDLLPGHINAAVAQLPATTTPEEHDGPWVSKPRRMHKQALTSS